MTTDHAWKRALVLCDNNFLFDVIESNLTHIKVKADWLKICSQSDQKPDQKTEIYSKNGRPDLIVVAISSAHSEPLVALFHAALIGQIGRVPLLIISDRKFEPCLEGQIFHLDFPFESAALRRTVQSLLAPP